MKSESSKLSKSILLHGFIKHSKVESDVIIFICIVDDWPHLVAKLMFEMSPADVFRRVITEKFSVT